MLSREGDRAAFSQDADDRITEFCAAFDRLREEF
jgi:hypothetical protein